MFVIIFVGMNRSFIFLFCLWMTGLLFLSSQKAFAVTDSIVPVDKSPTDIAYCPPFYPIHKAQDKLVEPLVARVVYSRPGKVGRQLFGKLVEYGKLWRLGANEATEIEFFKDVFLQKNKVKKGRYTLYAIPQETTCTLILNKETDTWGAFLYDEKKDVLRITLPVNQYNTSVENFTIYFTLNNTAGNMVCVWDTYSFTLPFTVAKQK